MRRRFLTEESGAVIVFVAFAFPLFLLMIAFVIDFGIARIVKNKLQISADAAALAGAAMLPNETDARTEAVVFAELNYSDEKAEGAVLRDADIQLGSWDVETRVFIEDGEPLNAVRVTTRRDTTNGNPLRTYFAMLADIDQFDLSQSAVAHLGAGEGCRGGGLFTEKNVLSGSNNDYVSGFCLYGAEGVKISSDNSFVDTVEVAMNSLSDFEQGGNNAGIEEVLTEADYDLALPARVPDIIDTLRGDTDEFDLPPFITNGPVELNEITDTTPLQPGTLYIVEEVADLGSNQTIENIAIVAKKEVKVGSNNTLENVVFASEDKVLLGSNNTIGAEDFCSTGLYGIYLFSMDNIEFGSNNDLRGVQIAGQKELKLGSDVAGISGVLGEVLDKIDYGSADKMGACAQSLGSFFALPIFPSAATSLVLVQ